MHWRLGIVCIAAACSRDFSFISQSQDAGADTEAAADAGGCVAPQDCVEVPAGWTGPYAVGTFGNSQAPPTCSGAFAASVFSLGSEPRSDASCGCECDSPIFAECSPVKVGSSSLSDCGLISGGSLLQISPGACVEVPVPASGRYINIAAATYSAQSCNPIPTVSIPPPRFATITVGCAAPQPAACGTAGTCLKPLDPPFDALCISRDGDRECPDGFSERRLVHATLEHDLACTECRCEAPEGTCTGDVVLTNADAPRGCDETVSTVYERVAPGACGEVLHTERRLAFWEPTAAGSCEPVGGELRGSVRPLDPVTLCCQP